MAGGGSWDISDRGRSVMQPVRKAGNRSIDPARRGPRRATESDWARWIQVGSTSPIHSQSIGRCGHRAGLRWSAARSRPHTRRHDVRASEWGRPVSGAPPNSNMGRNARPTPRAAAASNIRPNARPVLCKGGNACQYSVCRERWIQSSDPGAPLAYADVVPKPVAGAREESG